MSTVVLYCWCHSDSASVLLYFTCSGKPNILRDKNVIRLESRNTAGQPVDINDNESKIIASLNTICNYFDIKVKEM